jgi:hypothetical protein
MSGGTTPVGSGGRGLGFPGKDRSLWNSMQARGVHSRMQHEPTTHASKEGAKEAIAGLCLALLAKDPSRADRWGRSRVSKGVRQEIPATERGIAWLSDLRWRLTKPEIFGESESAGRSDQSTPSGPVAAPTTPKPSSGLLETRQSLRRLDRNSTLPPRRPLPVGCIPRQPKDRMCGSSVVQARQISSAPCETPSPSHQGVAVPAISPALVRKRSHRPGEDPNGLQPLPDRSCWIHALQNAVPKGLDRHDSVRGFAGRRLHDSSDSFDFPNWLCRWMFSSRAFGKASNAAGAPVNHIPA